MIGIDDAGLKFAPARLSIGQLQLPAPSGGFGEDVEDFEVENRLGSGAKGDGLFPVGGVEGDGVGQGRRHFFEGAGQRFFKGRAPILLEGFLGDKQGKKLALGDLERGKGADFLGVMEAIAVVVELDGQPHAVAHEFEVAIDGFGADFERCGQVFRVGKAAGLQFLVDAHHPLERRASDLGLFRNGFHGRGAWGHHSASAPAQKEKLGRAGLSAWGGARSVAAARDLP